MTTVQLAPFCPLLPKLETLLPAWTSELGDLQRAIPELAKDAKRLVIRFPTTREMKQPDKPEIRKK